MLDAPLLWDVADRAACLPDPRAFVAACQELAFVDPREYAHLDKLTRLRNARQLRFRAWRVLRAEHFAATHEEDVRELRRFAARLDLQLP